MCSAPSRAQALLQAGRTHTHTHHRDKPHRGSVDSQGHLCLASTQLQQPAHKSSRAQAGDAVRSRNSSQEKHIHCRAQLCPGEGLLLLPDWNPSGSQGMRSRLSNPSVCKEGSGKYCDGTVSVGYKHKQARQGRSCCRQVLGGKGSVHGTVQGNCVLLSVQCLS